MLHDGHEITSTSLQTRRPSLERAVALKSVREARWGGAAADSKEGESRQGDGQGSQQQPGGWNGIVDAHLMRLDTVEEMKQGRDYSSQISRLEETLNVFIAKGAATTIRWRKDICEEGGIEDLKEKLADYR